VAFDAAVGSFNTGTGAIGTTVVVSGLGFTPKVVFFWWNGRVDTIDAAGRASHQRGFGAATSPTARGYVGTASQDTPTAMEANRFQDDTQCIGILTATGTLDGLMDLQSLDSGGFTLEVDDVFAASYRVQYLALGGTDITDAVYSTFAKATVTGDQDVTTLAFQPDFVLFFTNQFSGIVGSPLADSRFTLGAADAALNQAVWMGGSNDGSATSQTASYCTDAEVLAAFSPTVAAVDVRAIFKSMLSNGFRVEWLEQTTAVADTIQFVAMKGGSYKVGSLLTRTDTTTDIVVSGLASQPAAALFVSHGKAESTVNTHQDDDELSIGAFSSTTARAAMAAADDDAAGTAIVSTAVEHDAVYANLNANTGALEGLMDIASVQSAGFTCIMDDADPVAAFAWYVAFGPTPAAADPRPFSAVVVTPTIPHYMEV